MNSLHSSVLDRVNSDNQSNEKILSNKKSKEMILSERENLIQNNRNQLSFIPEEFSEKRNRKK